MTSGLKGFVLDSKSGDYSASRAGIIFMMVMDAIWMLTFMLGWNRCPQWAVTPVSAMLGAVTGAVAGVYWGSTYTSGNSWMAMGSSVGAALPPIIPGIARAKPQGGQDGI
jgi:hypothetical protein